MSSDWEASSQAWLAAIERGDPNRLHLLDDPMLSLAAAKPGLWVADVGGGEGRFARMLQAQGAEVVVIDPTWGLVNAGHKTSPGIPFLRAVGERLPLPSASMDLVVSYLSLIDIPDFRTAIREMSRLLVPGGRLLVANLQSFVTSLPEPWLRDNEGNRTHFVIDDYFTEKANEVEWSDIRVINHHRPLSAYWQVFLAEGLVLTHFIEPVPSESAIQQAPGLAVGTRIPYFYVAQWQKPPCEKSS